MLTRYRKFIVAIAGALVSGLYVWLGPDDQWVHAIVATLTALGVYGAPNTEVTLAKDRGQSAVVWVVCGALIVLFLLWLAGKITF